MHAAAKLLPWTWCLVAAALFAEERPLPPATARAVDFRGDVYPLLKARCFACHAGADCEAAVRLDLHEEILGDTTGRPLVSVGQSATSRLIQLVAAVDPKSVMPPKGPRLSPEEVGLLRGWIDQGLAWDSTLLPPLAVRSNHWAFQPVHAGTARVPAPTANSQFNNAIDAFLQPKLEQAGLTPAPPADRQTLMRRLYLDVHGLPPLAQEVAAFAADPAPDAYDRLLDRVLASPRYGERMARHWLDLARYAETEGYESNHPRLHAWRYRDYVAAAFSADKPYDVFVRQQIAGDEMQPYTDENLIATGFLAAARISSNEEDKSLQRNQVLVDIVNATSQTFLGLTINCAQCHNHKFDPISSRDYYRLLGFFVNGQPLPVELAITAPADLPPEYEPALKLKQALFEAAVKRRELAIREKLTAEERTAVETPLAQRTREQELIARRVSTLMQPSSSEIERHIPEADRRLYDEAKKKVADLEKQGAALPQAWAFYSPTSSPHRLPVLPQIGFYPLPFDAGELAQLRSYICIRGEVNRIGPTVDSGWPAIFGHELAVFATKLDRLDLADWLTSRDHPLTARVWVNRLWQYRFGAGIVATSGDFGLKGSGPSHPELLDWLALELMNGWSTRDVERLILSSAAYRRSSRWAADANERDPANRWLWRFRPRRLEGETLRDAMLAASGELDLRIGGPSVGSPDDPATVRRSLYLLQKRGVPPEMQKLFDGPAEMAESCTRRHVSTTALQSLYLLNSPFVARRALALAERIAADRRLDPAAAIAAAFEAILGRRPQAGERLAASEFLEQQPAEVDRVERLALLCQTLLNTNELAYLE